MLKILGLSGLILTVLKKLLYLWVRTSVLPRTEMSLVGDEEAEGERGKGERVKGAELRRVLGINPEKPVVYVMQRRFLSNALVLAQESILAGLPPAWQSLHIGTWHYPRSFFFLSGNKTGPWGKRRETDAPLLRLLLEKAAQEPDLDVQIVPVTILWGRAPDDDKNSILKLLFSDGWSPRGRLRQAFTILLHGRHTMLRFSAPVALRELLQQDQAKGLQIAQTQRKLGRVLRVHFRRQREIAIGPDLSHRRNQIEMLLAAPKVVAAISADAAANGNHAAAFAKARANAHSYAWEIAADYSYPVILIMARFMRWVWNRIYNGLEIHNMDGVASIAPGNEIVYVPCHRSHIDYLLMSYVLFQHGLMVPHIAAGANLNIPLVGGILRRSGAFFLRRSFKGNKVYAAVFNEYLHMMIASGYPIEYFVEGGRSRSGRLLSPMGGMLAMTVQSFLRDSRRPILFVPVYIGYEKLFEGRTYVGELMGRPKQKENLLDLILTVRELKKNFGKVHVNFGQPIKLAEVLNQAHASWRDEVLLDDAPRPAWLQVGIERLMTEIAHGINNAAIATPVNLVALALLATPKQAMDETRLLNLLEGYRQLAQIHPYAQRTLVCSESAAEMIAYAEQLKLIIRQPHVLGDILYFSQEEAVLASYARNNILHLFAMPGLLACLFAQNPNLTHEQLLRLVQTIYPFLRAELFLRWSAEELEDAMQASLRALLQLGWLQEVEGVYAAPPINSDDYANLALLGQAVRPTLMRHFITLTMLTRLGSGKISPAALEALCHLQAQRLSMLREFNAPEFFDKVIFRTLIATLRQQGLAEVAEDGNLVFDHSLELAANEARHVLPPDVRQAIMHLSVADADKAVQWAAKK